MTELKRFLELKRLAKNINQKRIAQRLGIDQTTVSLYEGNPDRLVKKGANFVERFFSAYELSDEEKNVWFRKLYQDLMPYLNVNEDKSKSLNRIAALLETLSDEIRHYQSLS